MIDRQRFITFALLLLLSGCRASTTVTVHTGEDAETSSPPTSQTQSTATPAPPPEHQQGAATAAPPPSQQEQSSACNTSADCPDGMSCRGEAGCDAQWTCQPESPCTADLVPFCGCDGQVFRGSSSCPPRPYSRRGGCQGN